MSGGEEPSAERYRDPHAETRGKNVLVLNESDVKFGGNGQVFMPNTSEMTQLRKEKGQFRKNLKFTPGMTEMDVQRELLQNFPLLKNKRLSCASAADGRSRLEFYGEPRLWDGVLIRRHITGNSALYLLAQEVSNSNTSGYESMRDEAENQKMVISPPEGPTKGGTEFYIIFKDTNFLPKDMETTSLVACFDGCEAVTVYPFNPCTLSGNTPRSPSPGVKEVILKSLGSSWEGFETTFQFKD